MRSARVVSTVTRMMFGASAQVKRAMRRMKKRKAHRIRTKREFTRGKLPGAIRGSRKSERNRKPKLHVALGARTQDRVQPNAYIRCGEERSEPTGACTRDGVIRSAVDARICASQSLVRRIAANIGGERTPLLGPEERVNAPAFSDEFWESANRGHVVHQGKIHIPGSVKVRR